MSLEEKIRALLDKKKILVYFNPGVHDISFKVKIPKSEIEKEVLT